MRTELGLYRLRGLRRKPGDGERFLLAGGLELRLSLAGGLLETLRRFGDDLLNLAGGVRGLGGVLGRAIGDRFL